MTRVLSEERIRSAVASAVGHSYLPSSTYRVQFNRYFTFNHAKALSAYFKELGIDTIYSSPCFQAVPGSLHGYNTTDPRRLNPEIGNEEEFDQFCAALRANDMGLILDIVPNHMGVVGNNNPWWNDVLENGPSSLYASFFDIDWEPVKKELKDKVLVPVLGDLYGRLLENGEIRLVFDSPSFKIQYHEHHFPVDPRTYPFILEYGIDEIKKELGEATPDFLEYLGVLTTFKNLPSRTERQIEKMEERVRDKEAAKARLARLVIKSPAVRAFIDGRVGIFNGRKGDSKSFDLLDQLLNEQPYRMAFWRVAAEEINYRRFFNINELAAIRTEKPETFRQYHELPLRLVYEGKVQGFRIDHPDGLYDPPAYFRNLQRESVFELVRKELRDESDGRAFKPAEMESLRKTVARILTAEHASSAVFYIVVEKILDRREPLPDDWRVQGTVGYDFLNALNGLFIDPSREKDFEQIYESFIAHPIDFDQLVYDKKKFFSLVHMASEINALGHRLDLISERNRRYRDFTRNNLTLAIREVIACFPVYRTYISPEGAVSPRDEKYIRMAVTKAKTKTPALNAAVYDFLENVLLLRLDPDVSGEEEGLYRDFVLRFQQLTGPIMAKGVEDTSFYVYNRLLSLNEVGGDPFHFGYKPDEFHKHNMDRNTRWPFSMITGNTHDAKRSEDVRMRINALSEMPDEWNARILEWSSLNASHKTSMQGACEPRANTEYFIYQTLLGVWPEMTMSPEEHRCFTERMWEYFLKAVREAKIYTSWAQPNIEYEEAVKKFVFCALAPAPGNMFLESFLPFWKKVAHLGKLNSLSSLVLRTASPGVMDTYQGDELMNFTLVDPDNRGPVNFETRGKLLAELKRELSSGSRIQDLLPEWFKDQSGKLKLFFLWKGLGLRKISRGLFVGGDYLPLEILGARKRNVVAFLRKKGGRVALAAAGRFFSELLATPDDFMPARSVWADTSILLPEDFPLTSRLTNCFTGTQIGITESKEGRAVKAADVFGEASAAIFIKEG